MNRRHFLLAATAFTLLSTTAARADYVEDIVKVLKKEGYSEIDVTRTLLGRVRIVASRDGQLRELVCNPRTGEILRDVLSGPDGGDRVSRPSSTGGDDDSGKGDDGGGDDNSGHDDDDGDEDSGGADDEGDDEDDGGGDDDSDENKSDDGGND